MMVTAPPERRMIQSSLPKSVRGREEGTRSEGWREGEEGGKEREREGGREGETEGGTEGVSE